MRPLARVLAALLVVLGVSAPAFGADDRLGLSWDATTWTSSLTGTLFGGPGAISRWVPGDADTRSFYVRNRSGDDAFLSVDYALSPHPPLTPADLRLSVSVGGDAFRPIEPGDGWIQVDARRLDAGRTVRVAVRAVFDASSPNVTRREALPVDFRVTLAGSATPDAAADGGPGEGGSDAGGGGLLADAGAPRLWWTVGLGGACLIGGITIVAGARRREGRDAEAS